MPVSPQVKHEISMMWAQLHKHGWLKDGDWIEGLRVRFVGDVHRFNSYRELHAFLNGAFCEMNYINYEKGLIDGTD